MSRDRSYNQAWKYLQLTNNLKYRKSKKKKKEKKRRVKKSKKKREMKMKRKRLVKSCKNLQDTRNNIQS